MDWMKAISGIAQRYSEAGGGTASSPADTHSDFLRVVQNAPRDDVAGGLAEAFRSDRTRGINGT
jgi:hypothetical protein